MTLRVEHFHSTTHFKSEVMSMLQYCRAFGNCVKEKKGVCAVIGVHTTLRILTIGIRCQKVLPSQFKDMPKLKLPTTKTNPQNCQRLKNFASVYGRAVKQRSVHQTGTLPSSCYKTNLPIEKARKCCVQHMVHAATLTASVIHITAE